MSIDERVDCRLVNRLDFFEPQAHTIALHAPRDTAVGIDVALGAWESKPKAHFGAVRKRARCADGDPAAAQIQRERGGNGVAESIRDRNAKHDARTTSPVEIVGK